MKFIKKDWPVLLLAITPAVVMLIFWNRLPDKVPVHWNASLEVDGYGPKYLMPLMSIGIYLLMLVLPSIDPRKRNYDVFSGSYYKLRFLFSLFFAWISAFIYLGASGVDLPVDKVILSSVMLFITVMGNYLSSLKPNWFIGIRLPWTMDNEVVWRKTHVMAGRLWFWCGLAGFVAGLLAPSAALPAVLITLVVIIVGVPVVYSYLEFRKQKKAVR